MNIKNKPIAVIGLGYVGLPLAIEFGKVSPVIGFDIDRKRVEELQAGKDRTVECSYDEITNSSKLIFTSDPEDLSKANVYIVTVPTPVDSSNSPDLTPLIKASTEIGKVLKEGDVVIFESTVFPGATEEICVPVLEKYSGLKFNINFFCGYSPERINPGDKSHRLIEIKKITSGSLPEVADAVDDLYRQIIIPGTYKANSIKVAEAAKVIENIQRDINIALMNELSLIFNKLDIDTSEVLEAAGTKWNFLPFRPGLVGGHCIGVDPYYLTYKAQQVGYHPEIILAGRRVNDCISQYVAEKTVKLMLKKGISLLSSRILVLGLTFKENCTDIRNSKVIDIVNNLLSYHIQVDVYDPMIDFQEVQEKLDLNCLSTLPQNCQYDAIILAVSHRQFLEIGVDIIKSWGKPNSVFFDVKSVFSADTSDGRL